MVKEGQVPGMYSTAKMSLRYFDLIIFMVSQGVIPSKQIFGDAKPFAFKEQGIVMLSSVLNSRI